MTKELVISVKKLKHKYKVETTEGKYNFSEETIIKYSIFKGREFNKLEMDEILEEEESNSLMNKAINYLSYQARSEKEIIKYLIDKGSTEDLALKICDKIKELGYIDDNALAKSMLDYTIRTSKGPRVLEDKLSKKYLDEELTSKIVKSYTEEMEEDVLEDLLIKILPRYRSYPKKKQKLLIYQKLLRDGFSSEVVASSLNKVEFNDESDEELVKEIKSFIRKHEDNFDYNMKSKLISRLMNKGYEYSKINEALKSLE